MSLPVLSRALLIAAFSSFLVAQEPAINVAKVRQEAADAVQSGDFAAAAAGFKKLTEANPKDGAAWHMLGYSLHSAGKLDEALPVHIKASEFKAVAAMATYNVACVHALKGNADETFAWLDKAVAVGFSDIATLQGDTDMDLIRKDPRFAKLETAVKGKPGTPAVQAFAQSVDRKNARMAWFSRAGSPGQIAIDYSPVVWKDSNEKAIASGKFNGQKWRLGSDFWTRLDTMDMQLGGVAVPAGYYYLTLEQREGDSYVLALHDAAAVRKQKLDASAASKLQGGIEIPMTHATVDLAKALDIAIEMNDGSKTEGTISIHYGSHKVSAPFAVKID